MNEDGSVAGRLRRPTWRDPRLLVGVLLIAIAVVGVAFAVRAADRTDPFYVAAATLVPGTVLEREHLEVVSARVPDGSYLIAGAEAPYGQVVTRTVAAGELVPAAAVAAADDDDGRVVGVVAHAPISPDLAPGDAVDLWIASDAEARDGAAVVAEGLIVADIDRDDGAFSVPGGHTVYLVVPHDSVQVVLDALSSGGDVTIVGRGGL